VVGGAALATGFPAACVLTNLDRGFAVDAQALDLAFFVGVSWR
jgi:hypothetical protein